MGLLKAIILFMAGGACFYGSVTRFMSGETAVATALAFFGTWLGVWSLGAFDDAFKDTDSCDTDEQPKKKPQKIEQKTTAEQMPTAERTITDNENRCELESLDSLLNR